MDLIPLSTLSDVKILQQRFLQSILRERLLRNAARLTSRCSSLTSSQQGLGEGPDTSWRGSTAQILTISWTTFHRCWILLTPGIYYGWSTLRFRVVICSTHRLPPEAIAGAGYWEAPNHGHSSGRSRW
ncbi:leucine rich adaptor protein 1 isoform X1 [Lates japonicus]|uniref:Leucine rich adaptor protein 1 isoform X1 n=1 Tax=Lates japonicus TaxID=270547 RepID=A0AAD3M9N9_LATJO|nr:leucine rich adaptor protein 1 isoform X1 [Lates japonicus]